MAPSPDFAKPGWATSELSLAGCLGMAVFKIAELGAATVGDGILRGCACIALGWIAGRYAVARAQAKGRSGK